MEIIGYNVYEVRDNDMTAIMIQDKKDLGYTGYYLELPGVIAEGNDVNQTLVNLREAFDFYKTI